MDIRATFDDSLRQAEADLACLAAIEAREDEQGPSPETDRALAVLARECLGAWVRRASDAERALAKLQRDTMLLTMRALRAEQLLADGQTADGDIPPHSLGAQT